MKITIIGLDIAKRFFHVVCCNEQGRLIKKKMLKRAQVLTSFYPQEKIFSGIRSLCNIALLGKGNKKYENEVKLIPPQHMKAFLIGNKNDALAITVAAQKAYIKCVGVKAVEQQYNQAQHKTRALAVRQRTTLCNKIRGLIAEYGIILSQGVKNIPLMLDDETTLLSGSFKMILTQLKDQLTSLDDCINTYDKKLQPQQKAILFV
jgi:transposase